MVRPWVVLAMLALSPVGSAQAGTFGAPLGKLPVGYRVEWVTDPTRSWDVVDSTGRLHPVPRTVRVHLWYPAAAGTGSTMTFRDYLEPPVPAGVPKQLAEGIHGNDLGSPTYSFRGIFHDSVAAFDRAMKTAVAARGRARPAHGRYPVVIYSVGQNDFSQDAVAVAEWLASNGYVVASVPHLGTSPRRLLLFVHDPLSYETQLRDLEVALQKALTLENADPDRIVAMGHSYGGIYALLLAMRGNSIRGVIGLDPTYIAQRAGYEYDLRKFPFFNPDLRVPVVTLRRGSGSVNRDVVNALVHSDRLEVTYPDLMHGDFTTVAFIRAGLPAPFQLEDETKVRSPEVAAAGATGSFHQVLACTQAILSGRPLEGSVVEAPGLKQSVAWTPALHTPTNEELYWIYRGQGLEAARAAAKSALGNAGESALSPSRMLTIARELGYAGKNPESLDMFRLLASTFPDSATAQLASAEALLDAGLKNEARPLLEHVLQLDPNSQPAKDLLAKAKE